MDAGDEVILYQVQDAPDAIGQMFIDAIRRKDVAFLNHLVNKAYPDVLWGKYFKNLATDDQAWVTANLA